MQHFTFAKIMARVGLARAIPLIPHEKDLVTLVEYKIWSLLTLSSSIVIAVCSIVVGLAGLYKGNLKIWISS